MGIRPGAFTKYIKIVLITRIFCSRTGFVAMPICLNSGKKFCHHIYFEFDNQTLINNNEQTILQGQMSEKI